MPNLIANYDDALHYLFGRINYERVPAVHYTGREFKLERMQRLLNALGDPHLAMPAVHIAGTKGKGSTAVMLAEMLAAAGYRTGLFTSPHIHAFEERMQVNGRSPAPDELASLVLQAAGSVAELDLLGGDMQPTYFEVATAVAWLYFAQQAVELVVLEVGLGGRLDSTNLCRPLVCAITNISLDHTQLLGDTHAAIAAEKAGIIKPGVPVLSGVLHPEAAPVVREACVRNRAELWELGDSIRFEHHHGADALAAVVDVQTPVSRWTGMPLPLRGEHQAANAALALAALDVLSSKGFAVAPDAARGGLAAVRWPLRIEVISQQPLVILDAAHNPASIEALVQTLDSFESRRRVLIFGTSKDKDARRMLAALCGACDELIVTEYTTNPRAYPAAELAAICRDCDGPARLHRAANPREAWSLAAGLARADDLICVAGSFFLSAEIRAQLLGKVDAVPPGCVV